MLTMAAPMCSLASAWPDRLISLVHDARTLARIMLLKPPRLARRCLPCLLLQPQALGVGQFEQIIDVRCILYCVLYLRWIAEVAALH
jgi:hypothetical protein